MSAATQLVQTDKKDNSVNGAGALSLTTKDRSPSNIAEGTLRKQGSVLNATTVLPSFRPGQNLLQKIRSVKCHGSKVFEVIGDARRQMLKDSIRSTSKKLTSAEK